MDFSIQYVKDLYGLYSTRSGVRWRETVRRFALKRSLRICRPQVQILSGSPWPQLSMGWGFIVCNETIGASIDDTAKSRCTLIRRARLDHRPGPCPFTGI